MKIMYCIALQDSPGIKVKQKQMNPQRQRSAFIFLKLLIDLHLEVISLLLLLFSPVCDPMDCRTPDFCILHHLPELAQTHVHRVSDAIQPSHPLSSPSPPAFNPSQHQGLFQ